MVVGAVRRYSQGLVDINVSHGQTPLLVVESGGV